MKEAFRWIVASIVGIGLVVGLCTYKADAGEEWEVGVAITVPLNFKDIGNKGTLRVHGVYGHEADSVYTVIDNSIDNSIHVPEIPEDAKRAKIRVNKNTHSSKYNNRSVSHNPFGKNVQSSKGENSSTHHDVYIDIRR